MRMRPLLFVPAYALAAVFCCAVPVQAGLWSVPAGAAQDFTYANGQDEHGFFGEPIILGNKLIFTPSPFVAHAESDNSSLRHDTVSFDLLIKPNRRLDGIGSITMQGFYSAEGQDSLVDAWSEYSVDELGGSGRHFAAGMVTSPVAFPLAADVTAISGSWSGEVNMQAPGPANPFHQLLHIEFSTTVMADAVVGGNATVSQILPQVEFDFAFTLIPEPGSVPLIVLGCVFVMRRTYNRRAAG